MKTSKINKWIILCLALILSCCIMGVAVSFAQNDEDGYKGAKFAPEITVDFGDFDKDNVPNAVINKPYKIFSASAEDIFSKEIYVQTRVWIFYDSQTRSLLNIENNRIIPLSYGRYTVEYLATDRWGNQTTYLYDFDCVEKEQLSASVGTDSASYNSGESVTVNAPSFSNAIGQVEYSVQAKLKNGSIVYDVINLEFTPLYAGEYDIVYTFSDYNETESASYSITVNANTNLIWDTIPVISEYMFVGLEYTLPAITAYQLSTGEPISVPVTIVATDAQSGNLTLGADRRFTPLIEGVQSFNYTAQAGGKSISQVLTSSVIDIGGFDGSDMDMSKYFVGDNISKKITPNGVKLTTSISGATARFINPVNSQLVHVEVSAETAEAAKFSSIDVIIADAENSDNYLVVNLANGVEGGLFGLVDGKTVVTDACFKEDKTAFVIEYDNSNRTVYLPDTEKIVVKKDANGNPFNGFNSDLVVISVRVNGVTQSTSFKVLRIGNQVLYDEIGDGVAPDVVFDRWTGGEVQIGDIVTLKRVFVSDVLCPVVDISYSVKAPDGSYVTDLLGNSLENADYTKSYQFEVTQNGRYIVTVKAQDVFGNQAMYDYPVVSVSNNMLVISLNDDGAKTARVGETVSISTFTVAGYDINDLAVRVCYIAPNQVVKQFTEGSFKAEMTGEYQVWYYVSDSDANTDMVCYTVKVS